MNFNLYLFSLFQNSHHKVETEVVKKRFITRQKKSVYKKKAHQNMLKRSRPIVIIDGTEEFQDYGVTLKDLLDFYGTIYLLDEENTAHHRKDYILEDGKTYKLIKKPIEVSISG